MRRRAGPEESTGLSGVLPPPPLPRLSSLGDKSASFWSIPRELISGRCFSVIFLLSASFLSAILLVAAPRSLSGVDLASVAIRRPFVGLFGRVAADSNDGVDIGRADPSIFSKCEYPPSVSDHQVRTRAPCVYFRPVRHFATSSEGYAVDDASSQSQPMISVLEGLLAGSGVNLLPWALQVNDFEGIDYSSSSSSSIHGGRTGIGIAHGETTFRQPRLREGLSSHHGLTSVSALMSPKVGSRTVEDLFRFVLSEPRHDALGMNELENDDGNGTASNGSVSAHESKVPLRPRGGLIGHAVPAFWDEVQRRRESKEVHADAASAHSSDVVFALVRDPVSRFLSSLAQILSAPMRRRCRRCRESLDPCIEAAAGDASSSDFGALLRCTIDVISAGVDDPDGGYFDRHILPQAVFLYGGLAGRDIELAVFDMDGGGLDRVVGAFGLNGSAMHRNERENKILDPDLVRHFGKDLFLNPKKTWDALDNDMVRDICAIYKIDVEMMRYLGFPPANCDESMIGVGINLTVAG